MVLTTKRAYNI